MTHCMCVFLHIYLSISASSFLSFRRLTCGECLANSSQCAWCESAQTCFYFAAYLTKFPYGECRDWYDR